MREWAIVCILICMVALAACAPPPLGVESPAGAPEAQGARDVVRVGRYGSGSVKDVPWLVALDSLRADGYVVEVTEFAKTDLIAAALEQGEIDFAPNSASIAWAAASRGADNCSLAGYYNGPFDVVTRVDIQSCEDLDGQTIAFNSRQSIYIQFAQYIEDHCPGASPDIVLITRSENRLAALLAQEVDGAHLELSDWVRLNSLMPGTYHMLIDYGVDIPELQAGVLAVRCAWAEQHPEVVTDFLRALLTAQRMLTEDPVLLQAEIVRIVGLDAAEAQAVSEAYLAQHIWDINGGMTPESIRYGLDFLSKAGFLPEDLTVADVADLSYLDAVLDELGRK